MLCNSDQKNVGNYANGNVNKVNMVHMSKMYVELSTYRDGVCEKQHLRSENTIL